MLLAGAHGPNVVHECSMSDSSRIHSARVLVCGAASVAAFVLGLVVLRFVGTQHRREALHHLGVELPGGPGAQVGHAVAVVSGDLEAPAHGERPSHPRDGAAAAAIGVPRAVPALVTVNERLHGVLAHLLSLIHISEPTRRTPISYAV